MTTTNYYLYLIDLDNKIIVRSYYTGNTDYIRYVLPETCLAGYYKIRIARSSSLDSSAQLALSFNKVGG